MKERKRMLIIRFSSIGDVILTTPVIRCAYKAGYTVDFVVKPCYSELLLDNPYIHRLWYYTPSRQIDLLNNFYRRYDAIVDLQNNFRSRRLTYRLHAPVRRLRKLNLRKWVLTNFKINLMPSGDHIVKRYLEVARPFGVEDDGLGLDIFLDSEKGFWQKMRHQLPKQYITLAIGSAHRTKSIPVELGSAILSKLQLPTVIVGAVKDWKDAQLMIESSGKRDVLNMCGKCSIRQSAVLIAQSKLLITPDTGMMHIATALKKPVLVIWGSTVPALGMGPYYGNTLVPHAHFEVHGLSCRPCSKLGYPRCPNGSFQCMLGHNPSAITQRAHQIAQSLA